MMAYLSEAHPVCSILMRQRERQLREHIPTSFDRNYGKSLQNTGYVITRDDFVSGYTLFIFQVEPYLDGQSEYLSLIKTGSLRLDVEFSKPLTHTMTTIIYAEAPGYVEVTKSRGIIVE